jgi:outer membrane protein insertion porin family
VILKAYTAAKNNSLTILSIILGYLACSCSVTRGVKPDQAIVRKITINGLSKDYSLQAVNYVDKEQQPNNWLNLQFYYTFSRHGKKDIGEAPRLLDTNLVDFSKRQIQNFLINKGFLKAKVESAIKVQNKKAELIFNTNTGPLFHIRKFQDSIADKNVRALYRKYRNSFSHIQPGAPYDVDSLAYDRDQIYQLMKRNGYYDFYRQYINYTFDSTFNKSVVDVNMIISNPVDADTHPVFTINNTLITVLLSNGKPGPKTDTIQVDSQFRFVDYTHKLKPKVVTRYIFQQKGDIYDIDRQNLTTSRLSELNIFRNVPSPTYKKTADSTNRLNSYIEMIPLKKMSDRVEAEYIASGGFLGFNGGRYGYNLGNTFTDRNIFKSAAILQLKLNWSVLFDGSNNNTSGTGGIENQDFKAGASLIYPSIISPFNFQQPGKYGVPHTTFSTSYQLFFQKGSVSRKSFINSITYDWAETTQKLHSLTPINIEFSKGIIDPDAQKLLLQQGRYSYIYLIGRTIFTSGSQYIYQYNANKLSTLGDFTYFRGNVDVGGNTLWALSKLFNAPKDSTGYKIFGYNFAQYTKFETDIRFYKNIQGERELVFRINPGIGIPYGNSNQLIFEKNFYAGGSNDIRAWLPRTLGPGDFNRASYGPDTVVRNNVFVNRDTRNRLKYLDQFGEIKIVGNIEYRYELSDNFFGSKLNGAVFTDFGNIWRLKPEADSPNGTFNLKNLFQSSAIGIGTGLRFDLAFFVFRLDAAFKFKDPQFIGGDQWVFIKHFNELLRAGSFKNNYYISNGETYNFMQLNFGIGLPF